MVPALLGVGAIVYGLYRYQKSKQSKELTALASPNPPPGTTFAQALAAASKLAQQQSPAQQAAAALAHATPFATPFAQNPVPAGTAAALHFAQSASKQQPASTDPKISANVSVPTSGSWSAGVNFKL